MPWYIPQVPEGIKKRVCIYLLQRYFGQFFEEKLTLDQLSLDLYNGRGTVANVSLDVQALNELGEKQNWPMEFVDGYLEELIINVPWTSLLKESSYVEVRGLKLTVQPKQRMESATSMFESMWSSMSNSMQLAQECMKQQAPSTADNSQPLEGIERFAQTIDSILSRVKVTFVDTIIQVEHVPRNSNSGVAIQIKIDVMEYLDEAGNDPPADEASDFSGQDQNKAYVVSSFTSKNLYLEGVSFSTVEFPSIARTFSRSVLSQSQIFSCEPDKQDSLVTMIQKSVDEDCTTDTENSDSPESGGFDEQRHVIKFGKVSGRQEIRIRMKQSENVCGPKVSIESNFGSFTLFLSPRQVHVLLELANGLWSPDLEDTSNVAPRQKCAEKPMTGLDYQRVEQELQHQIHPLSTFQAPGLQGLHGWSTAPLEESDDDNFLPLKNMAGVTMYDSATSVVSSSMESSLSSSMASSLSEVNARTRRRVSNIDSDPTAEISHFQIRLASLTVILLHEDLLTLSTDSSQALVISSVQQMQNTAKNFFDNLQPINTTHGYGNKDFDNIKKNMFETACHLSHLRLLAAPVQIEAKETTTQTAFSVSGKLTAARLELLECLTNSKDEPFEYVKLLGFLRPSGSPPVVAKPSLTLTFKHIEKTVKSGLSRRVSTPKTDIGITLDACVAEIDVTIVDRVCALLNPQPVCVINKSVQNVWSRNITSTQVDSKLDIKIMSPSITFTLRFPVPDFRPQHDMQRTPWWKRSVRSDFLTLQFTDVTAETLLQSNQACQKYTLECRTLDVFYHEVENCTPLHIGKAGLDEKYVSSVQDGFSWPRIVLNIYPLLKQDVELEQVSEPEVDLMSQSIYGNLINQNKKQHGPFSAKRVVHESDTPHARPHKDDSAELIIPGDKQEMNEFIELTTQRARIYLEVALPVVTAQLVSKHVYEVLYNRINSDLLLWEPSAPKPKPPSFDNAIFSGFAALTVEQDTFAMCKSGIQYDSEDDMDQEQSNVYYSIYDSRMKHSTKNRATTILHSEPRGQSQFVFNLHIAHGSIGMNTPVRDLATNVIPNQHGEFYLTVEDAGVFSVSGYHGDDNLGYVCVQVKSAQLHHCDMISTPSQSPPLMESGATVPKHLHLTVCKSEPGVLTTGPKTATAKDRGGDRDMLAVAIKIQASHETHHVKTVRVAVGLNKATLKHRMCLEPNSWITQLIDFFNVFDYPIPGYHAKDVLTEFHLHSWDCAIDYRPLHIPLRSVLSLGNFSMSSHLSAQANTSTLRFIAEECGLFLSEKGPPRNGIASIATVDLQRDFVNVVEVGLFELSLKINDKKTGVNPHIDLRASNNQVHIRTCADSGRALMQLLTYLASDGDLAPPDPSAATTGSAVSSPRHQTEQELVKVDPQNISKLSKSQHQHVNELLGEAMKESMSIREGTSDIANTGAKLFFFPDESHPPSSTDNNGGNKPLPQVTFELGDVTFRSNKSSDTDDEFYFVGDEAGLGILPKNGLPEIRWLTEDPLRIIENHFSIPVGKTDLLKPPEHFPMPVMRYTLCEMSVTWHMYGGNDFKSTNPEQQKAKKTVNFSDTHISHSVGFSNTHTGEIIFTNVGSKKKPPLDWRVKGGVNRDHGVLMELQLNKVRFQHEVYPESTTQASRQVLLITELEIRDRLESSQINKFLYQYTSESRPKQSHANMVVIKAVHIRPDPKLKAQECCLKVSLLPLRLHIDQDSLLFLISFFTELSTASTETEETCHHQYASSKHSTPTHQPPIMTVSAEDEKELLAQAHKVVDEHLLILLEEKRMMTTQEQPVTYSVDVEDESTPIYFRSIIFAPEVPIRLDYHGKRVDMSHGPLPGLLMGLAQLNCSELRLKRLSNRHGLLGFEKLMSYCLHEWLNDIKKNQLPSLLGGVGPIHSLVQLFQGIKDLFWLPIEQYQKDGRIVRGLQRGANSFTKSTVMAALELTSRIIHLVLITAETAYDMMSPGPSVKRTRYSQPQDFREGVANAYMLVKEGIGETADNIVRVATHEREQKGYSGAVGGVLRQIPPTMMKPIIIASEATNNVLGGVRSQLVPDVRREATEKWKNDEA